MKAINVCAKIHKNGHHMTEVRSYFTILFSFWDGEVKIKMPNIYVILKSEKINS